MANVLFQIPTQKPAPIEESRTTAAFAMLGVIAIIGIISLTFLFQRALSIQTREQTIGHVIQNAQALCTEPGAFIVSELYTGIFKKQGYACGATRYKDIRCCLKR